MSVITDLSLRTALNVLYKDIRDRIETNSIASTLVFAMDSDPAFEIDYTEAKSYPNTVFRTMKAYTINTGTASVPVMEKRAKEGSATRFDIERAGMIPVFSEEGRILAIGRVVTTMATASVVAFTEYRKPSDVELDFEAFVERFLTELADKASVVQLEQARNSLQYAISQRLTSTDITPGTFTKVEVGANGLVTLGTQLTSADIPNITVDQVDGLRELAENITVGGELNLNDLLNTMGNKIDRDEFETLSFRVDGKADTSVVNSQLLLKANVGVLDQIERTVSQLELNFSSKVDKVPGKGLSTLDYTNADKTYLDSLRESGAGATADGTSIVVTNGKLSLPNRGVADTKPKVSWNSKGIVTGGAPLEPEDIPNIQISKINGLRQELDDINLSLGTGGGGGSGSYTLPVASSSIRGGVKVPVDNHGLHMNQDKLVLDLATITADGAMSYADKNLLIQLSNKVTELEAMIGDGGGVGGDLSEALRQIRDALSPRGYEALPTLKSILDVLATVASPVVTFFSDMYYPAPYTMSDDFWYENLGLVRLASSQYIHEGETLDYNYDTELLNQSHDHGDGYFGAPYMSMAETFNIEKILITE